MNQSLTILFLLCATAIAQSNTTDVIVRSELVGRTNFVHWLTVDTSNAVGIVTVNLTNEAPKPKTTVLVSYDATGTIMTSTDFWHWEKIQVRWTNTFEYPVVEPVRLFTAPAVPALNPVNGVIR